MRFCRESKIIGEQATSIVHSSSYVETLIRYFKGKYSTHNYVSLFNIRRKRIWAGAAFF